MSKYRPTRRHACARTVCVPRLKLYETPTSKKKLETSVDLNRRAADGAGDFGEAVGGRARHVVKTLCARIVFPEPGNRVARIAPAPESPSVFHFPPNCHPPRN